MMVRLSLLAAVVLHLVVISSQQDSDLLNIRLRLGPSSEAKINGQINREFRAMYMYEAMTSHFGGPSVGLPGFKKFFKKAADEEREHAHKLIDYLNKRGGHVLLRPIASSHKCAYTNSYKFEWTTALEAVKLALDAEKNITTELYDLRDQADTERDVHLIDFIEFEFLSEQMSRISDLRELIAKITRAGSGLGELLLDKELL